MKTLVIHTQDKTTDFLKPIYAFLKNVTIVDGKLSKNELKNLVIHHERSIFLGHGTSKGLSSINKYNYNGEYIVDHSFKNILINNHENIYLWCDSDIFINNNKLCGLYIGMFISDIEESKRFGFNNVTQDEIDESNNFFSKILADNIFKPSRDIYKNLIEKYSNFSIINRIASFNVERIYYK